MRPAPTGDQARELLDRIRASLPDRRVREVRMFGAIAVMLDDAMAVAVHKDGSLLVRVDPAEDARLLEDPDARRAEMGAGRSMSEGWIRVEANGLRSDAALTGWLDAAVRHLAHRKPTRRKRATSSNAPTAGGSARGVLGWQRDATADRRRTRCLERPGGKPGAPLRACRLG